MKRTFLNQLHPILLCSVLLISVQTWAQAPAPKLLFDPTAPNAAALLAPNDNAGDDVTYAVANGGIDVTVVANGKSSYPGVKIIPTTPWNASGYGHIEAKITNTGTDRIRLSLRVDNAGPWQENRYSADSVAVKPGATATLSAIFGYQWTAASYPLDPSAIISMTFFSGKSKVPQSFHIDTIQAAGPAGEKPFLNPTTIAVKPAGGILLGPGVTIDPAKQTVAKAGATAALAPDGQSLQLSFPAAAGDTPPSVVLKPASGKWNLNQQLEVRVHVKNTGTAPATPGVELESDGGPSAVVTAAQPIAPGGETDIVVPFAQAEPWQPADDPRLVDPTVKAEFLAAKPGTGTKYRSNVTSGVTIFGDKAVPATLVITSVLADIPPQPTLPGWLGQRPPVPGDWTKTFDDSFTGNSIDLTKWNIYTENEWHLGAQTHYTKDNVIVNNGTLTLRVEKKYGHHNDDPTMPANGYATGYADTYGKWTQRYGYFEARMKLPTAPNMFLAFWMMPDRGIDGGPQWIRGDTKNGGMEFDIMETLAIWGLNRHDFGFHWDGYQKFHKSTGSFTDYVQPDKDGFITVGMLWTPGEIVIYDNGVETGRWDSPRIGSVPEYFILDHITGGWETEPLDEKQLPADFVISYVRAWQRKDLASAVDGPKPNDGGPLPPKPVTPAAAPAPATPAPASPVPAAPTP